MAVATAARVDDLRLRAGRRRARGGGRLARASTACASTLAAPGGRPSDVAIPALGRLAVHNALAAAAVGLAAGLDLDAIVGGARRAAGRRAASRRARPAARRRRSSTTPTTPRRGRCAAALDLLAGLPGRRVAVLGEMLELGDGHEAGHREVGEAAAATSTELLVVVGAGAGGIAAGARAAGLDAARILDVAGPRGGARRSRGRACATATSCSSRRRAASSSTCSSTPFARSSSARGGRAMTVELIQGLLLAFALVVILMPPYIRLLQAPRLRQAIRDRGSRDPPRQGRHADDGRRC